MTEQTTDEIVRSLDRDRAAHGTTTIVAAYLSHNALNRDDVPAFIADVNTAMLAVYATQAPDPESAELTPAVPIRSSVKADYIICLEDGAKFKSLKRHLATHYDLTPEQYRERWNLPADYPMVAPNYSATRSRLAKENGLGKK